MLRHITTTVTVLLLIDIAFGQEPIQLDESCIVTVGNQTVFVRPDGSYLIQNIAVFQSRTTGIAPQLYRVRATCVRNGETITGQSDFFELTPGETTFIADVFPSALDPIPVRVSVSAPGGSLETGASLQLTTVATLPDSSTEDVTPRSAGTTYLSTNPAVLTVTEDGFVTSVYSGSFQATGTIAALNEGNITTVNITAVPPANDLDNDGMPNDYEDLFGLNKFFNDANLDLDNDGLTNITEFNLGTIPNNPDTDIDGVIDGTDCDPLVPENAAPTVQIISPADGATLIEGETIQFSVSANDDSVLVSVELSTDTGFSEVFPNPGCNASIQVNFTVPIGPSQIVFTATATDVVPNVREESVVVNVIPDPLTTVIGVVVDPDDFPIEGAELSTNGDVTGFSMSDGSFSIPDVPTILGDIVVTASAEIAGEPFFGISAPVPPNAAGTTDVGTVVLTSCAFNTDIGTGLNQSDDDTDFVPFSQGFTFPYFGTTQTGIFINSNGNLTFGSGDRTFNPSIPSTIVNGRLRISPTFVDFNPRVAGDVFFNQFPDRFVVTWSNVPLFRAGGSNTFQVVLHSDGRIQFIYNGLTANGTQQGFGSDLLDISVAVTPGGTPSLLTVDYSADTPLSSGAGQAVFENFSFGNLFDLDFKCVLWQPNGGDGFDVRVVSLAPCVPAGIVSGIVLDADGNPIPDCPIMVTSSANPDFAAPSQSAGDGTFVVVDVPVPGGINVTAYESNDIIGVASGILWNEGDRLDVIVGPIPPAEKP